MKVENWTAHVENLILNGECCTLQMNNEHSTVIIESCNVNWTGNVTLKNKLWKLKCERSKLWFFPLYVNKSQVHFYVRILSSIYKSLILYNE